MIVIRPTASLAKRMKVKLADTDQISTGKLGDWYALNIVLARKQYIMAVSSVTRLAVILEAAPYATFPDRLPSAVKELLTFMAISKDAITSELFHMSHRVLAKTQNRSILGRMNDHRFQLEVRMSHDPWGKFMTTLEMAKMLNNIPSLVLPGTYPESVTKELFASGPILG